VVLLSYQFWRTHFARQKDVLGRTLRLNDELFTIVGVLPEHTGLGSSLFRGSSALSFDVVAPLRASEMNATFNYLVVIGKIWPHLSVAEATAAIDSQTPAVNQQFGSDNKTQVIPLETYLMGDTRPLLFILLGAVAAVLLITCANTASLLLARGAARQKEIAVRLALGAGNIRIFRQFLTESLLVSLIGGSLGLLLLWGAREGLLNLLADRLPSGIAIPIDSSILLLTLSLSLVTGLSFGVAPSLQARKRHIRDALGQGDRMSRSAGSQRVRSMLVVAEIACSLALLAGAGLLVRSFVRLLNVDKGYSSEHVLTLRFWPGLSYTPETQISYLRSILQGTRELPGVQNVGFSTNLPLGGNMTTGRFDLEGRPFDTHNPIVGSKMLVSGDYFRALRIPLIAGRFFTPRDEEPKAPPVTIVDQAFAQLYFKDESPLGKRINFGWGGGGWAQIIGVVGAVREMSLAAEAQPTVYAPMAQRGSAAVHSNIFMAVRSSGDPKMQAQAAKDVIHRFNGGQIVERVRTMNEVIDESVAANRAPMWLFAGFAAIAVLLAAIGVYGVLSYYVVQRRQEIGIRMALGARRCDVLRMVLGHASRLVAAGLVAGLAISLASSRAVTSLLFGTRPTDVPTFIAVAALLAFIGLIASIVPVIRATKVDPQMVLRGE
jgi:predicted permease